MKKTTKLLIIGLIMSICLVFSGCGNKTINLNDYVFVDISGYDTVGTAKLEIDYEEIVEENYKKFGLDEDSSDFDIAAVAAYLEENIDVELDKTKELSNGEEVKLEWKKVKEDKLKKKFDVKIKYSDKKYKVENLDIAEEFNPFDYVNVKFSGMSPNGYADVETGSEMPVSVSFDIANNGNLKLGEKIIVKINDIEYFTKKCYESGKIPTQTEAEYVVSGLSGYVMNFSEIPEETLNKMKKQTEDTIKANAAGWNEGNSIQSMEYAGYYFVSAKDGASYGNKNISYVVYKITASLTGVREGDNSKTKVTGTEVYYTYCSFNDIIILEDGTASVNLTSAKLCSHKAKSSFGSYSWGFSPYRYYGYRDIDSMFNDCIVPLIDRYDYENNVK